jgi:glycyl-tRNA synthetase beta chain
MGKHQRYFTLEELDGSLAPLFLTARNGDAEGLEIVRAGNERVLAFRFNDAVHHYNEDLKTTLEEKRAHLSRVVFMQRLGSMLDRSERLERLVTAWCRRLGRDDLLERAACAAHLSKADLASQMVAELPELQGVMGREYGVLEGLDPAVAQAIGEQYMPKTAGDPLPQSEAGRLLALADRIDLLIAALSLGHAPTGSSDPFGLRRAAAGVTALLAEMPPSLAPAALVEDGLAAFREEEYYRASSPRPGAEVAAGVLALLTARLEAQLLAEGVRRDLADAVLNGRPGSVPSLLGRARFLRSRLSDPSWEPVSQSATRIRNILRPTDGAPEELDPARLEQPEEQALHAAVEAAAPELDRALAALNWEAAWARWAALAPAITTFFDEVLVNAPDPELAAARRGLLRRLDAGFLAVADFSRTVDLQAAE